MQAVAELMGFCAERAASDYVHSNVCKNGITALNTLCERFELHNYRDGSHFMIAYASGECVSSLQNFGTTAKNGVSVRFKPDGVLVGHTAFDAVELQRWVSSIPIDSATADIQWNDERDANTRYQCRARGARLASFFK